MYVCTSKGKERGEVEGLTYVMPLLQHPAQFGVNPALHRCGIRLYIMQPTHLRRWITYQSTIPTGSHHNTMLQLKNSIQRTQSPVNNNARINSGFPRTKYGRHYLGLKAVIFPNTTKSKSTTIQSSCTPTNRKKEPQAEVELDDSSVYQIVVVTLYQPTDKIILYYSDKLAAFSALTLLVEQQEGL